MTDKQKIYKDWMKFLDPDEVKFQLISASLYLTAYDLLIESIIQKIKDFYTNGFNENGLTLDTKYETQVRELYRKDIIIASLIWLEKNGVISKDDIQSVKNFKIHRNELAHELSKMISDSGKRTKTEYIGQIRDLYFKIQKWWFVEFEVTINPELSNVDPNELDYDEVLSFIMMPMNYMVEITNEELRKKEDRSN
ncbi:hypothetical protein SAMN05421749_11126 [Acinetobacter marinus]|uniref:Uncharacterized protein n=1 Tax=Acinetobacter marinus TaxID=281375 RepID=A0A1G6NX65_9GAMM|nr:hypothetical protein [Acinetobacter marinus]SDC72231.1 hypothetical protein SAMN05421749_11126 [Acinetobacter marinus]